jgi:hypothetical protein
MPTGTRAAAHPYRARHGRVVLAGAWPVRPRADRRSTGTRYDCASRSYARTPERIAGDRAVQRGVLSAMRSSPTAAPTAHRLPLTDVRSPSRRKPRALAASLRSSSRTTRRPAQHRDRMDRQAARRGGDRVRCSRRVLAAPTPSTRSPSLRPSGSVLPVLASSRAGGCHVWQPPAILTLVVRVVLFRVLVLLRRCLRRFLRLGRRSSLRLF